MIKKIKYSAIIMMLLTACSLEEDRSSVSAPDNFFRSYTECQWTVNSCYAPMKTIYNGQMFIATECVSDLMNCAGSGKVDAKLEITPATPLFGATAWTQGYRGVSRSNFAIWGIENAGDAITEEERVQLLCEARSMRGFYYLFLTSLFGDVPFYFDYVEDVAAQDRIGTLPRMDAAATRDSVINDLMKIAPLAAQTRTSDNDEARSGAALAYMVAAKCAMWNKDYATALTALESLEAIYGELSAYDYTQNVMFRNKNTPESILEVQHIYEQGGLSYTSNLASFCTPKKKVKNEIAYFDGVEIPEIGPQATTYTAARPNVSFLAKQPRDGKDIRAKVNMAWDYNGQEFSSVGTKPWLGPKFWCPGLQAAYDGNNYKVYRYADAVLMMAECHCELGDNDKAVSYLNQVKKRAGLDEYVFTDADALRQEIRDERGRELFGEFQRKFDLVRWGIFEEAVLNNTDYNSLRNNLKPCHRYYPIPDTEVVDSKYNLDNNEYEEYGF